MNFKKRFQTILTNMSEVNKEAWKQAGADMQGWDNQVQVQWAGDFSQSELIEMINGNHSDDAELAKQFLYGAQVAVKCNSDYGYLMGTETNEEIESILSDYFAFPEED